MKKPDGAQLYAASLSGMVDPGYRKLLRRKLREARARDPAGMRRLERLSVAELRKLEIFLLERAISQLSLNSTPAAQAKLAEYQDSLRCAREAEFWRQYSRRHKRGGGVPRYRPKLPAPPTASPPPLAPDAPEAQGAHPVAGPERTPEPTPPPPANVVPIRPDMSWCLPKAFGVRGGS